MKTDKELRQAVLASSAIAGLMEPYRVNINGIIKTMSDGGHRHVLPLPPEGATHIDAVCCFPIREKPRTYDQINSIYESARWLIDMQMEANQLADIEHLKHLAHDGAKVTVYAPAQQVGGLLDADKETISNWMKLGKLALSNPIML